MALEYNSHIYPPLGFVFKEADGTKFRGSSWADLQRKVTEYRVQRGSPGDVAGDILKQVCNTQPAVCRDSHPAPPSPSPRARKPDRVMPPSQITSRIWGDVTARVSNWVNHMLGKVRQGTVQQVPRGEARNRANICANCSMQQVIASSCGGCVSAIRFARGTIIGGEGSVEPRLQACRVLGEDTATSIHLVLKPEADPQLPDHCWRKLR